MPDLPAWARSAAAPAAAAVSSTTTQSTQPAQRPNPFRAQRQGATGTEGRGGRVDVPEAQLALQKQEEAEEKARIAAEIQASVSGLQKAELKRLKQETAAAARTAKQAAAIAGKASGQSSGPCSSAAAESAQGGGNPFAQAPAAAPTAATGRKKTPLALKAAALRESTSAREAATATRTEKQAERAARRKKKDRCRGASLRTARNPFAPSPGSLQPHARRCCGVSPWHGCLGCIALGLLASVVGSAMLAPAACGHTSPRLRPHANSGLHSPAARWQHAGSTPAARRQHAGSTPAR